MNLFKRSLIPVLLLFSMTMSIQVVADGMVVDKVYHPYVLPFERSLEWRLASHNTTDRNLLNQRLGYGHSVSEYVTTELYLIGERDHEDHFDLHAYEWETRWMITDQGRYWADWGMLFEVERESNKDNWEASAGVLMEKEFGRTSLTLNAFAIYEWGQEIADEWESEVRLQYRYRLRPQFQPAIEVYSGERFLGLGPGFMGVERFDRQRQLKWEMGYITEVTQAGRNNTLRMTLEYEY